MPAIRLGSILGQRQPDQVTTAPVEGELHGWTPLAIDGVPLGHEAYLDQVTGEVRHRGLGEPRERRQLGPRQRAGRADRLNDGAM